MRNIGLAFSFLPPAVGRPGSMSNSTRLRLETSWSWKGLPKPSTGRQSFWGDRKSTRLNSSHGYISYAVFCLKKKKHKASPPQTYALLTEPPFDDKPYKSACLTRRSRPLQPMLSHAIPPTHIARALPPHELCT